MKRFVDLFKSIDEDSGTLSKVRALVEYFRHTEDRDKLWAIALFSHRRPKRTISTTLLRKWAAEKACISPWLFEESYHLVGDLAETISLLIPDTGRHTQRSLHDWITAIIDQKDSTEDHKKSFVSEAWASMSSEEIFLFNKIITGGFRVGVSQKLIIKALSVYLDEDENKVAHKLMGDWSPQTTSFSKLLVQSDWKDDSSRPYPFYLGYAIEEDVTTLGDIDSWQCEWKWDGIRAQIIKRQHQLFIWSRGEELVTDKYPEFSSLLAVPYDFVLDGELVIWKEGQVGEFHLLQKRIGRKAISAKMLKELPVGLIAYDILELNGIDVRDKVLAQRRRQLEKLMNEMFSLEIQCLQLSKIVQVANWQELKGIREMSRENLAEGLMLKLKSGIYKSGRKRGEWWKWKVEPFSIDAVMLYAQRGHGRRSSLFTDFTFAVWEDEQLVPFAKAYSGLTDAEFTELTQWINKNTMDKFGPVRSVMPQLVFEIAFDGIQLSTRHKCGIAVRFPRIKRWRRDKAASEANDLEELKRMIG